MNEDPEAKRIDGPTLVLPPEGPRNSIRVQKSKLLVLSGPLQGREFIVAKDRFAVGSGPRNDLILDDTTVSRRHCEIECVADGYVIRDLGSTNGTIVQGVRVTEAFLDQSTEFQLGKTRFIFCPLQEAVEYPLSEKEAFGAVLGRSVAMRRVFHVAETYAPTDAVVLIEGETGTGKEVLAEEIHRHSRRASKPFIVIDCAALARDLIESELFGHTKGAFTGAVGDRVGAFEHADGGTVFLDEISDLSPELQPKLLRVLEKKEVRRVGSNQVRPIDVRIIAATNRKLANEVNAGRFREDLYFRLSVVYVELPPLRKRRDDIPPLVAHFWREFHPSEPDAGPPDLDRALEAFQRHDWPGNVRELRNVIEIASYAGRQGGNLGAFLCFGRLRGAEPAVEGSFAAADRPFKDAKNDLISRFEKQYVRDILAKHDGNITQAAREAQIERAYLQRLVRKYNLKP
jgi:transcriptional regulator with PAS, ATPase and Fis domain